MDESPGRARFVIDYCRSLETGDSTAIVEAATRRKRGKYVYLSDAETARFLRGWTACSPRCSRYRV
jgi:hypothetical protein